MSHVTDTDPLIAQLHSAPGRAEIVGGRIVVMSSTGDLPSIASGAIFASLRHYAKLHSGRAYPDNVAYLVDLPERQSFSPDASYDYETGPRSQMKFLPQPPDFAVELRSEGDYGPAAEERIVRKRAEYFAAGTKVVWDVDLLSQEVVRSYRSESPENPVEFCRTDLAAAEPAVPGWSILVAELFE